MRAHSSAVSIARPVYPRQHSFRESVQMRRDVDDFKRALCAPFHEAAYGSRKDCGNLVMLAKNAERETNKVAETMVRLSFGALSLVGLDAARKPCQVLDAMLCAKVAGAQRSREDEGRAYQRNLREPVVTTVQFLILCAFVFLLLAVGIRLAWEKIERAEEARRQSVRERIGVVPATTSMIDSDDSLPESISQYMERTRKSHPRRAS